MDNKLIEAFKNPGSEYRGAPFWAWNGKLEPNELKRQIRIMHKMGLGGFFMHSRVGLDTTYLSDEWFDCIKVCIDEAEKLDMQAWLYDEDRWPSGAAGGLVTKNPEYRQHCLHLVEYQAVEEFQKQDNTLACFLAEVNSNRLSQLTPLREADLPDELGKNQVILHFYVKTQEPSSWYNGFTYLDTLNHEAVKEFINVTHEEYRKRIGDKFGKSVPGIFTDEPNFHHICVTDEQNHSVTPWTAKLPKFFKERYGYDILDHLPELFYDIDGQDISQARYHFCDCLTFLFVDAFGRQLGEWCDENNMMHTGHLLQEDTLVTQVSYVGNCMRFYEYMQAPGIDLLTEHRRIYDTPKQVSSAANQFGQKWRLTETYGCTGWDFPFAGHKAVGDWQAALGINLRCQHLSWYTMQGEAKRDYPASILYQSPWWEQYSKVEDYFARIHVAMTQGKEVHDLLFIQPTESIWTMTKKHWHQDEEVLSFDKNFRKLRDHLLSANLDFDFGDEEIMSRHGRVEIVDGIPKLIIGQAEYTVVIVPEMKTMRSTTLELLQQFKQAGGEVVFAGAPAQFVDAKAADDVSKLAALCLSFSRNSSALTSTLSRYSRRVSITDQDQGEIHSCLHLLKEDQSCYYLFVCNTSNDKKTATSGDIIDKSMVTERKDAFDRAVLQLNADCGGPVLELNPDNGEIYKVEAERQKSSVIIHTSLPELGSRLFIFCKKEDNLDLPTARLLNETKKRILNDDKWNIIKSEDNVLVLDKPAYKIGKQDWQLPLEILKVDYAVRDALGIQRRGGQMVQPWAVEKTVDPKRLHVQLKYTFDVETVPSGALYLAIECPKTFDITLNGYSIYSDMACGWWCDKSLKKLPVNPSNLKIGKNELILTCSYDENHYGFEIIYFLGNFGVKLERSQPTLIKPVETLKLGDWVTQGLPFYSGSVCYHKQFRLAAAEGNSVFVRVPDYHGTALRILVNGSEAGIIAWQPNEVEITPFLIDGDNDLKLEVISHRRNSHGPFHYSEKHPDWTGPAQYVSEGDLWTDQYQLVSCGLMSQPELVFKQ